MRGRGPVPLVPVPAPFLSNPFLTRAGNFRVLRGIEHRCLPALMLRRWSR